MSTVYDFFNHIFWWFYRLTPKGRQAWKFKKGLEGLLNSERLRRATKRNMFAQARDQLKPLKIIGFFKGRSINKSRKTDHQVIEKVRKQNSGELDQRGLRIDDKGRFKKK